MAQATSKREAFEIIYQNLTSLQDSYRRMLLHCSKQLWDVQQGQEAYDPEEEKLRIALSKNIQAAEDSMIRIERIKYHASLAILTEGSCMTEKDLSNTIEELDFLLKVSAVEVEIEDIEISDWANLKIQHLENTRGVLLQVLGHKITTKVTRNAAYYQ